MSVRLCYKDCEDILQKINTKLNEKRWYIQKGYGISATEYTLYCKGVEMLKGTLKETYTFLKGLSIGLGIDVDRRETYEDSTIKSGELYFTIKRTCLNEFEANKIGFFPFIDYHYDFKYYPKRDTKHIYITTTIKMYNQKKFSEIKTINLKEFSVDVFSFKNLKTLKDRISFLLQKTNDKLIFLFYASTDEENRKTGLTYLKAISLEHSELSSICNLENYIELYNENIIGLYIKDFKIFNTVEDLKRIKI